MTTYVVGVDGSDHALQALEWARATAAADDTILAVHGWEIPIVTGYEAVAAVDTTAVEQAAAEFLASVVGEQGDARVTGRLATGHPGRSLVEVAEEVDGPVTVVVGHAGSSKVGLLLGSTANYTVQHADVPVVVVRGDVRLPVRTVVVGVDEARSGDEPDEPSLRALRWALDFPGAERVEVHHAAFVPSLVAGPLSQPGMESDEELSEADRLLQDAIAAAGGGREGSGAAPAGGPAVVPVVGAGTGAFDLIESSREADLIVIGTRGRRSVVQLITGSTTLEVLAHAHCPVAVVR